MHRRRTDAAVLLAIVCALAACTSAVPGAGRPAPPVSAPTPAPSVGTRVEAIRLAAATPLVEDLLPERVNGCRPFGPFIDPAELERLAFLPGTVEPTLRRSGFVAAWSQCRQEENGRGTLAMAVAVADSASAAAVVIDLAGIGGLSPDDAVTLPASGAVGTLVSGGGQETVQAWSSVGPTVGYVFHVATPGRAAPEADQLMVDQLALLRAYEPTPPDQVAALPPDPDGLRAFTIEPPGRVEPLTGPYGLDSLVRQAIEPVTEREVLRSAGFTGAYNRSSVDGSTAYSITTYAFPTSTQTNAAYDEFARLESVDYGGVPIVVPSVAAAPCFALDVGTEADPVHYQRCYVGYGRYLARVEVIGADDPDDTLVMDPLLVAQRDLIDGS